MADPDRQFDDGMSTDLHPAQIEAYRRMTPAEKWGEAVRLYRQARNLKRAGLRMAYPDWSEERIDEEIQKIFLNASTP